MARSSFIAEEIDFEGIEKSMGALEPPKLRLEEVLRRVRDKMIESRKRGVTVEQLAETLRDKGIEVGVRNLNHFIEKGELLGGRPKRGTSPVEQSAAAAEGVPPAAEAGATASVASGRGEGL